MLKFIIECFSQQQWMPNEKNFEQHPSKQLKGKKKNNNSSDNELL